MVKIQNKRHNKLFKKIHFAGVFYYKINKHIHNFVVTKFIIKYYIPLTQIAVTIIWNYWIVDGLNLTFSMRCATNKLKHWTKLILGILETSLDCRNRNKKQVLIAGILDAARQNCYLCKRLCPKSEESRM